MTERRIVLALLIAAGLATMGQYNSAFAAGGQLPLKPGWDICKAGGGAIQYNILPAGSGSSLFHLKLNLHGVEPNTTYHLYVGDYNQASAFGGLTAAGGPLTFTRTDCNSGITKAAARTSFSITAVTTDSRGNANFETRFVVARGTYALQFAITPGDSGAASFKTGNSYADTFAVAVP